ncbi:pheromone A receptor-domain-containing protein [Durotheca rogersii]|uniref:pheromone A receptor-domain-containing protein n=1 Tax=Durotheca rogersii TaxID=419775 RepID=UPI00221EB5BC|nr:pheromone A receptor-domain-containing protein [Durotheca rogersii]KAI5864526.1 pheromone A receptor-domain-containing protein [Durotheca rogersii]
MDDGRFAPNPSLRANLVLRVFFAVLAVALCWVPLRLFWRKRDVAAVALLAALVLLDLLATVNALLWPSDVWDVWWDGAGLCEVEVYLWMPLRTIYAAAIFAIVRDLACKVRAVPSAALLPSPSRSRGCGCAGRIWVQAAIVFSVPLFQLLFTWFDLTQRYEIGTIVGCMPVFDDSWPRIVVYDLPILVFTLASLPYAFLAFKRYHATSKSTLPFLRAKSRSRWRLYGVSLMILLIYLPVSLYFVVSNIADVVRSNDFRPYSYARVHALPRPGSELGGSGGTHPYPWDAVFFVPSWDLPSHVANQAWFTIATTVGVAVFFGSTKEARTTYRAYAAAARARFVRHRELHARGHSGPRRHRLHSSSRRIWPHWNLHHGGPHRRDMLDLEAVYGDEYYAKAEYPRGSRYRRSPYYFDLEPDSDSDPDGGCEWNPELILPIAEPSANPFRSLSFRVPFASANRTAAGPSAIRAPPRALLLAALWPGAAGRPGRPGAVIPPVVPDRTSSLYHERSFIRRAASRVVAPTAAALASLRGRTAAREARSKNSRSGGSSNAEAIGATTTRAGGSGGGTNSSRSKKRQKNVGRTETENPTKQPLVSPPPEALRPTNFRSFGALRRSSSAYTYISTTISPSNSASACACGPASAGASFPSFASGRTNLQIPPLPPQYSAPATTPVGWPLTAIRGGGNEAEDAGKGFVRVPILSARLCPQRQVSEKESRKVFRTALAAAAAGATRETWRSAPLSSSSYSETTRLS